MVVAFKTFCEQFLYISLYSTTSAITNFQNTVDTLWVGFFYGWYFQVNVKWNGSHVCCFRKFQIVWHSDRVNVMKTIEQENLPNEIQS